jgi:hypothetical protein
LKEATLATESSQEKVAASQAIRQKLESELKQVQDTQKALEDQLQRDNIQGKEQTALLQERKKSPNYRFLNVNTV